MFRIKHLQKEYAPVQLIKLLNIPIGYHYTLITKKRDLYLWVKMLFLLFILEAQRILTQIQY